jgi:glucose-6-phosphate 1-dehydrogenase
MHVMCALQARSNRMFFLSIPPNVFVAAAGGAADHCSSK